MRHKKYFFYLPIALLINACTSEIDSSPALFTLLPASQSGIHFNNTITEAADDSTLLLEFAYMGGGVGIGDFNNDGLKDIYFTANQTSSRLYINKDNNQFEDITDKAGVATAVWATGVSIVDINGDGYDDIYVCTFGKDHAHRAKNLLFINQKDLTFKEEAEAYGLADTSYSTQAAFFDYDKDGDLDMYLLNYMLNGPNANTIFPRNLTGTSPANDRLYRNDGNGHFTDVTLEAGIKDDGYGLGVVISDFNNDGWPDIYVSDDFLSNDFMWINNRDGTFTNRVATALRHQSYSGMGVDAADFNNDGLTDIATVDMMPENNERKKISYSFMNYERYQMERQMNYEPEFMRNMLHLNNGLRPGDKDSIPFFSEIGQLAGMSETDWSWSVLIADFNNDGYKDMHITNGIGRDFINADFVQFTSTVAGMNNEAEKKRIIKNKLASLEYVKLKNYFLLNNKDLSFKYFSDSAGIRELSMSNGAAWADLDNDGDLDLVVNNINEKAHIYINNTDKKHHFLQIQFDDGGLNPRGFGAKVYVTVDGMVMLQEQNPVRGYLSTMDTKLTFGLGDNAVADVKIVWPDNHSISYKGVSADTLLVVKKSDASPDTTTSRPPSILFTEISSALPYRHKETEFNDFGVQRLLPQKYSQLGPYIATGDINGDGLEDFFIGGGFNASGKIFVQQKNGSFVSRNLIDSTKLEEDLDCLFFDADNDQDLDLVVTSGDVRYEENSPANAPRLYINDGKGNFSLQPNAFPASVRTIAGCVAAGDFDGDGDNDLFIGGRVHKQFPLSPKSFILENDNGIFKEVTASVCPALQEGGMITSAIWTDFDNDNQLDLIVAGEWMPIRFFKNNQGKLTEIPSPSGHGMWRSLAAADIDNDGDIDIIAGNLGLNCHYRISSQYPVKLFAKDIDNNGSIDPVMFYHILTNSGERKLYPAIGKDMLTSQVPALKKKFVLHEQYIPTTVDDIFTDKTNLLELTCQEAATCYFENKGNGQFVKHVLPIEAQFAPVNSILCNDFDNDGHLDLLLAGNEYQVEVMIGRYDASYGLLLRGNGKGSFASVPPAQSGFITNGDVKNMKLLRTKSETLVLVAVNDDWMQAFKLLR